MRAMVVLAALFSTPVSAHASTYWNHNGSVVRLEASGATRKFYYHQPRQGLPVTGGTLLFSGSKRGESYSGMAYIFSSRCGPQPYTVSGTVDADQRGITLYGRAPRLDGNCRVVGGRDDVLVFTFMEQQEQQVSSPFRKRLRLGVNTKGFHPDPCGSGGADLYTTTPTQQTAQYFRSLLAGTSLPNVELLESNVHNACTLIHDNVRYVVFGDFFKGTRADADPEEAGALEVVILAHEIGHHVCKHSGYSNDREANWRGELEADRYAGWLIGKLAKAGRLAGWRNTAGEFIVDWVSQHYFASMGGGDTHPPGHLRRKAFLDGLRIGPPDC